MQTKPSRATVACAIAPASRISATRSWLNINIIRRDHVTDPDDARRCGLVRRILVDARFDLVTEKEMRDQTRDRPGGAASPERADGVAFDQLSDLQAACRSRVMRAAMRPCGSERAQSSRFCPAARRALAQLSCL